jgi:hypothetical protein
MPRCGIMVIKTICNIVWMCHIKKNTLCICHGFVVTYDQQEKGRGGLIHNHQRAPPTICFGTWSHCNAIWLKRRGVYIYGVGLLTIWNRAVTLLQRAVITYATGSYGAPIRPGAGAWMEGQRAMRLATWPTIWPCKGAAPAFGGLTLIIKSKVGFFERIWLFLIKYA